MPIPIDDFFAQLVDIMCFLVLGKLLPFSFSELKTEYHLRMKNCNFEFFPFEIRVLVGPTRRHYETATLIFKV